MDEKFLEFWGTFLLSAARGKKQMDEMVSVMRKGFPDLGAAGGKPESEIYGEAAALFRKLYGLDRFIEYTEDYGKMVRKAMDDYQGSFKEYLSMMGVVSRKDHLELVEKYEELKKTCAKQEETIRHLQLLLSTKDGGQGDAMESLRNIVKDQGELFQKMMSDFSRYLGQKEPRASKQKSERKENGTD